jgi:hypothetical protein|tara:strand:- start:373 stop:588 length:216 start_codon:yes stop_codon:yes gene_type:complete
MSKLWVDVKIAGEHLYRLRSAWGRSEQKHYEEEFGHLHLETNDASRIPTCGLEDSNYKSLRILADFFDGIL